MGTGSPGGRLISPSAGGEPASSTPGAFDLLEREAELGELERLIAGAKGGAGSILLLEGPPGIGKTELLARAVELGSNAGLEVLQASGSELEQDFAFGIARQLFEQPIQELDAKTREQVLDGAAALSAHLVGAHSGLPARTGAPSDLFSLLHGLYWLCANLSASRPLLIAIDDAHWADTASLKFVHYLARRLEGLPILVVLALRSTHPEAPVPLVEAVRAESPVAALELRALSQPATHRLVEESFDQAPDRVFVRACHDVSGGNPFLLTELARSLAADGVAPGAPAAADVLDVRSGTISRHVLVRLSRLGDEAQALARAIAVIGPTAETHRAAAVAGISEEAAIEAVDALDAARVLAPQRPLRFGHALLRNAVYDDLTRGSASRPARARRAGCSPMRISPPRPSRATSCTRSRRAMSGWWRCFAMRVDRRSPVAVRRSRPHTCAEHSRKGRGSRRRSWSSSVERPVARASPKPGICSAVRSTRPTTTRFACERWSSWAWTWPTRAISRSPRPSSGARSPRSIRSARELVRAAGDDGRC